MGKLKFLIACFAVFVFVPRNIFGQEAAWSRQWDAPPEGLRLEEYQKRHGDSVHPKISPQTEGWTRILERRLNQAKYIPNEGNRWDANVQISSAIIQKNFTENGWGLTRAPDELVETLRRTIREGLPTASYEHDVQVIDGEPCLFISRPKLTERVLYELLPIHEAWSGEELVPYLAYGFRLYRNQSSLLMHTDKTNTHIISCILHIDSSDDAEDWPIVIEDLQGNTNEVVLTPGDMLLYESSKCFHGRPSRFHGSWYSSVFVHYYPKSDEWRSVDHDWESHYAVVPGWYETPEEPARYPALDVRGTSMREPECENDWCGLATAVKWKGPAEKDVVLTTGGKRSPLFGQKAPLGDNPDESEEL